MECRKLRSLIQKYIDNETSEAERIVVEEHVGSCSSCRNELFFWKELEAYAGREKKSVPVDFTFNLLKKLEKLQAVKGHNFREWMFLPLAKMGWAFAMIAVIVITIPVSFSLIHKKQSSIVQFRVNIPEASSVALAGDFNDWDADDCQLIKEGGVWKTSVKLNPGRYHYMFIVDGEEWISDPCANEYIDDGYGSTNAVLDMLG